MANDQKKDQKNRQQQNSNKDKSFQDCDNKQQQEKNKDKNKSNKF